MQWCPWFGTNFSLKLTQETGQFRISILFNLQENIFLDFKVWSKYSNPLFYNHFSLLGILIVNDFLMPSWPAIATWRFDSIEYKVNRHTLHTAWNFAVWGVHFLRPSWPAISSYRFELIEYNVYRHTLCTTLNFALWAWFPMQLSGAI